MAKRTFSSKVRQRRLSRITYRIFDITRRERDFVLLTLLLLLGSRLIAPYPHLAMWFGFALASYSAIANDSIQTIGTFIASNAHRKWWHLWLFMGSIFVATVTYSWWAYDGDVSYQKLTSKGFTEAPSTFSFLQLCAPIVLLILTRMRIPVSTTFLLLNVFTTDSQAMWNIFQKSFYGYFIAFGIAVPVWYLVALLDKKYLKGRPGGAGWTVLQWISSGLLWSVWLMQDAANIAVFLPRQLSLPALILFIGCIVAGLGILFYGRGERMQHLVDEKTGIKDIRAAALVDLVYMAILYYFNNLNRLPMSTTWIFIGLLGGRELAISLTKKKGIRRQRAWRKSIQCIQNDFRHALIGLLVSIMLSLLVNPVIRSSVIALLQEGASFLPT